MRLSGCICVLMFGNVVKVTKRFLPCNLFLCLRVADSRLALVRALIAKKFDSFQGSEVFFLFLFFFFLFFFLFLKFSVQ